ncbi:MAG: alpha-D-glucose phosphate-specific phosphoglucomutase, partial [Gammaproteobacteria bacterium]|nr:alpha-D-glucose phosphate-specific phosphoglucomutase [Gammaproteobacteria bacterium]
ALDSDAAGTLFADLAGRLTELPGQALSGMTIETADEFRYVDPIDGGVSDHQGIRIGFADGARIVFRLSGTGTQGATLRVYFERYEPDAAAHDLDTAQALAALTDAAEALAGIRARTGRAAPDVIT